MKHLTQFAFVTLLFMSMASCTADVKWEYKVVGYDAQKIQSDEKNYQSGTDFFKRAISSTSIAITESSLNTMGKEGWEIVSSHLESETVFPNLLASGSGVNGLQPNIRPQKLVVVFKRPIKK